MMAAVTPEAASTPSVDAVVSEDQETNSTVQLTPAFVMLGSDDVGACVDGVCEIPATS